MGGVVTPVSIKRHGGVVYFRSQPSTDVPMLDSTTSSDPTAARSHWMAVLARADTGELERGWDQLADAPTYRWLRQPETGLLMLRARAGGTGCKFNLGEASVTRCVVRTDDGFTGVSYILGRDERRAELAAAFDALLQDSARRGDIERTLIRPLAQAQQERRDAASRKAAATQVEFYTLARGDDE